MTGSALASSFVKAANYTPVASRTIDLVVVHDMEYPERLSAAEDVAQFFARQKKDPKTGSSAHYNVDADTIVQCVAEHDVAWHAPGANHNGIGIEHAGYAAQRAEEWADAYSSAALTLSARLTADICGRYGIPKIFVDAAGLFAGKRGITTHWEVTKAFKRGNHTDPGPNFPMAHYIALVNGGAAQEADFMATMSDAEKAQLLDDTHATREFLGPMNDHLSAMIAIVGAKIEQDGDGNVDVDKLAASLSKSLGDDVAKALGERLANG